jgi:endonuclease YncB( thermonuclease family)
MITDHPPAIMIDGDTFRLGSERIRRIDIDAPEMGNGARCDAERNLANLAKEKLAEIVKGAQLQIDRRGKDRFGRTLAYIRVSGADVGEMLIRAHVAVKWEGRRADWCSRSTK